MYPQIRETLTPEFTRHIHLPTNLADAHTLVEYALAGMDNQLFVFKYWLELPDKDEMQYFIEAQLREAVS